MKVRVTGSSMRPTLADGDVVEVRVADGSQVRIGDVVLVLDAERKMLLHRVFSRGRHTLQTQGDAAPTADDPVPHTRVIGIADLPRRKARAIAHRLATVSVRGVFRKIFTGEQAALSDSCRTPTSGREPCADQRNRRK